MTDVVLVGIITATASICGSVVTICAQYIKEKSFKNKDIIRKDLNTLYMLSNEMLINKKILKGNLDHIKVLNKERANFYITGLIPQSNIWEIIKKENILCVIDDRILTEKLFNFYDFIEQSIISHKHESEEVIKESARKEVLMEVLENIDDILYRINIKINELYKKLEH